MTLLLPPYTMTLSFSSTLLFVTRDTGATQEPVSVAGLRGALAQSSPPPTGPSVGWEEKMAGRSTELVTLSGRW